MSAQNDNSRNATGFTTVQAYTLAIITLAIGIAMGYFARGSAAPSSSNDTVQASTPSATAPAGMGAAQLPGIGSTQQQGSSPEMLAKAAEPLLAQLKSNPNDFDTLAKLGNLYYDGQAYPQAIEYYEKALTLQPNNPDVRTDLGTSYWYTGNADKAIASFDKSLAIRPNHPGTLFNLGIVKWQGKKDPKGAVVAWEQLLKTNPDYAQKDQVQMLIERAKMHGANPTKG
ncbi:MAG: tetratricopeptide repeat protein [Candidatus Korobacteraceae bacterium]